MRDIDSKFNFYRRLSVIFCPPSPEFGFCLLYEPPLLSLKIGLKYCVKRGATGYLCDSMFMTLRHFNNTFYFGAFLTENAFLVLFQNGIV